MPSYVVFGMFIITLVAPLIVAVGVAIYGSKYTRYFFGLIGVVLAIGLHAGIAYYSYIQYPGWWSGQDWPLGAVYIPGLVVNVIGTVGALSLAEKVDAERRSTYGNNVRGLRRSA